MNDKPSKLEWAILIIFIVSAIVILYYRIVIPASENSQLSTVLLGTFDVVLSLYIGYFLQKVDSEKKSRETLKKYGLLAYRRITDIKKSINRAFLEIAKIKRTAPNQIDAINSILEGTFDTVESSVLDWVDIISEDIKKKEKVDRLEQEYAISSSHSELSNEDRNRLERIKEEIVKLRADIPVVLQTNNKFETKFSEYMSKIFSSKREDGTFLLYTKITLDLPLSEENRHNIVDGSPYFLKASYRFGNVFIDIYNKYKRKIGYLIPSIAYDKYLQEQAFILNAFIRENEDDDMKVFLMAFDNIFNFGAMEDEDGYCIPQKCEFDGFADNGYFRISFASAEFPGG